MFTLLDSKTKKNLNSSRTTHDGSQRLWEYPQPTLDAPREPKRQQKPSNLVFLLKTYEKQPKLQKNAKKIEKSPKDDRHMDCKCKKVDFFPKDDWLMDWKYKNEK